MITVIKKESQEDVAELEEPEELDRAENDLHAICSRRHG